MKTVNRKDLYDQVWAEPMTKVARKYGLSDRGLAKLCERNSIPVPPRGYWAQKAAGQKVKKAPLIIIEDKKPDTAILLSKAEPVVSVTTTSKKEKTWGENPLHEIVSAQTPSAPAEGVFVDRVARNLREGRFLLLILGDGIREEMAALAEYLMHHSLRYAFGMVEIRLFNMPDGSVLALPRVLAKTQTIERHVAVDQVLQPVFVIRRLVERDRL